MTEKNKKYAILVLSNKLDELKLSQSKAETEAGKMYYQYNISSLEIVIQTLESVPDKESIVFGLDILNSEKSKSPLELMRNQIDNVINYLLNSV